VADLVDLFFPEKTAKEEEGLLALAALEEKMVKIFDLRPDWKSLNLGELSRELVGQALYDFLQKQYEGREQRYTPDTFKEVSKFLLLSTLDGLWKDHLLSMDHLREGIGLRGYGQKDPLLEYKREGFVLFQEMIRQFREDVLEKLFHIQIASPASPSSEAAPPKIPNIVRRPSDRLLMGRGPSPAISAGGPLAAAASNPVAVAPPTSHSKAPSHPKAGRNDPCPCGSGKKYKKCCGA